MNTIKEFSLVKAISEIREGDKSVPVGATGTIVDVLLGGIGYQVEFTEPKHLVISVTRFEIEEIK